MQQTMIAFLVTLILTISGTRVFAVGVTFQEAKQLRDEVSSILIHPFFLIHISFHLSIHLFGVLMFVDLKP